MALIPHPPKRSARAGYERLGREDDKQQRVDPDGLVRVLSVSSTGKAF